MKIGWKTLSGFKIYIQCFQRFLLRLISTFLFTLERVAPSTHCLSKPKRLQSIFCLCPWAEVAIDLQNNRFNCPVLVLLLLSHSAIFASVGLVLLKTLSYLPLTELHHLVVHVSLITPLYPSISCPFPSEKYLPLKSSFCSFSLHSIYPSWAMSHILMTSIIIIAYLVSYSVSLRPALQVALTWNFQLTALHL